MFNFKSKINADIMKKINKLKFEEEWRRIAWEECMERAMKFADCAELRHAYMHQATVFDKEAYQYALRRIELEKTVV